MSLYLFSEPYRPEGSIDARAAKRAIGRPHLDPWSLFLRETVQNSWDARLNNRGPIDFAVDSFWPTKEQYRTLRTEIFTGNPGGSDVRAQLRTQLPMLVITDRGTKGLGGPTRADLTTAGPSDFVDFVRNIGRREDKALGGGTYGFGKGVLYDASICATILVFTRTTAAGKPVTRLMGIALGSTFARSGSRFTGRHWWGIADPTTGAEPVVGDEAQQLAEAVGIMRIPKGETGTSIMVLGPVAQYGETLDQITESIAQAALWWAWPHMLTDRGKASVAFSFSMDGESLPVPDPSAHPVLRHYAGAYRRAESLLAGNPPVEGWPWSDVPLTADRPARRLGALSYRRVQSESLGHLAGPGVPEIGSHIALMRNPRMVVRYLEVTADPTGQATLGVFIADPELNNDFAMSEPVAHDDWSPDNLRLEKFARNPVKQALERLRRQFRRDYGQVPVREAGTRFTGVARLSSAMGRLLEGMPGGVDARMPPVERAKSDPGGRAGDFRGGEGAGTMPSRSAGNDLSRINATVAGAPRLRVYGNGAAVVFDVRVEIPQNLAPALLTAEPLVMLDGGGAEQPGDEPLGEEGAELLGWTWADAEELVVSPSLRVMKPGSHDLQVLVRPPADAAVTLKVHASGRPI